MNDQQLISDLSRMVSKLLNALPINTYEQNNALMKQATDLVKKTKKRLSPTIPRPTARNLFNAMQDECFVSYGGHVIAGVSAVQIIIVTTKVRYIDIQDLDVNLLSFIGPDYMLNWPLYYTTKSVHKEAYTREQVVTQAYCMAIATVLKDHGEDVIAEEMYKGVKLTTSQLIEAGVDDMDIRTLEQLAAKYEKK